MKLEVGTQVLIVKMGNKKGVYYPISMVKSSVTKVTSRTVHVHGTSRIFKTDGSVYGNEYSMTHLEEFDQAKLDKFNEEQKAKNTRQALLTRIANTIPTLSNEKLQEIADMLS